MSDVQKTINILNELPETIAAKISMRKISEIFSIMFAMNESDDFEPTTRDFIEALYISSKIDQGIEDVKNGHFYTSEELKKELEV